MQLKDEKAFWEWYDVQSNDDHATSYGRAIFHYAWRWALMMEYLMDLGYELDEMASDMSYLADEEGVTGFMHGAAAAVIAHCWVCGEEFRQWYNLDLQIGNEGESANESGGILNPALLNIG